MITNSSWLIFSVTLLFFLILVLCTYNRNDVAKLLPAINLQPATNNLTTPDATAEPPVVEQHTFTLKPPLSFTAAAANHSKVRLFSSLNKNIIIHMHIYFSLSHFYIYVILCCVSFFFNVCCVCLYIIYIAPEEG